MNWTLLTQRVDHVLGGAIEDSAEETTRALLEEMGPWFPDFDLDQMRGLPHEAIEALRSGPDESGVLDVAAVAGAASARLPLSPTQATEIVPAICRVIDETLDDEGQRHFRRNLPDELVETFDRSVSFQNTKMAGTGHTLADGKSGSTRPIAESDVAEDDSIAASDDPKGNTKLSGASGTSQERLHRTLAEGRPGSTRSVADQKSE